MCPSCWFRILSYIKKKPQQPHHGMISLCLFIQDVNVSVNAFCQPWGELPPPFLPYNGFQHPATLSCKIHPSGKWTDGWFLCAGHCVSCSHPSKFIFTNMYFYAAGTIKSFLNYSWNFFFVVSTHRKWEPVCTPVCTFAVTILETVLFWQNSFFFNIWKNPLLQLPPFNGVFGYLTVWNATKKDPV